MVLKIRTTTLAQWHSMVNPTMPYHEKWSKDLFIDSIVKGVRPNEAMRDGTAFHAVLEDLVAGRACYGLGEEEPETACYEWGDYEVGKTGVICRVPRRAQHAEAIRDFVMPDEVDVELPPVGSLTEELVECSYPEFDAILTGHIDAIDRGVVWDYKTTGRRNFASYRSSLQHDCYMVLTDLQEFTYAVFEIRPKKHERARRQAPILSFSELKLHRTSETERRVRRALGGLTKFWRENNLPEED